MIENKNWYVSQREFWYYYFKHRDSEALLRGGQSLKRIFCEFVNVVYLELSSYCNRQCSYCPVSVYPRAQRDMGEDIFKKIMDELVEIDYRNTVSVSLYNEPLADARLAEKIRQIHKNLPYCYVRFNSNGDYMTMETLDELNEAGCREIQVTLHFAPNETYNDEIAEEKIDGFFRRLGMDYEVKHRKQGHNITIDRIYKNIRLLVLTNNWEEDGNSRGGIIEKLNGEGRFFPCSAPFREVAIDIDGNFRRCCNLFVSAKAMDNVRHTDIVEFFFSEKMMRMRRNLLVFSKKRFMPCDTCSSPDYASSEDWEEWNGMVRERFGDM